MSSTLVQRPGRTGNLAHRKEKAVSSVELLGEQRELRIVHQGEQYILRVTRLGKLILTK